MRILRAIVVLSAVVLLSGCATLQKYPAFGTVGGGRLLFYDRQGAHNVLPPSGRYMTAQPKATPNAQPVH
jgi:hypothetical protein